MNVANSHSTHFDHFEINHSLHFEHIDNTDYQSVDHKLRKKYKFGFVEYC